MFDPSLSLSGNISRGKTEGYSYNNTTIDAGNKLHINIENGTIKGANISGNDVDVNVKGNLEIASLQDYEEISQRSIGGTVGNVTGNARSYSGQIGVTNGTKNWIEEQTSIIGRNSIRVDVGNKLTLTGSKISNEENGIDKGNLEVRAKEIDSRDIEGYDDLMSVNVEGTVSRKDIYHNQKNGKEAYERYENDGAVTVEGHEREQIARAAIGNGTIQGNVSGGIHRDINTSSEITKGVEVKPVRVEYNDERTDWGSTDKILAQNAETFGKFLDDIGVPKLDKGITSTGLEIPEELRKSNEEFFMEITYTNVLKIEDGINKVTGNYIHGLIPTSGVHGGLLEQIPKFVIEDENKIYRVITIVKNGEQFYKIKKADRLDAEELKRYDRENKLFNNGMNESLEKAAANSARQYLNTSNGQSVPDGIYETILIYNPTRGLLPDIAETGLGKVFNGRWSSGGLNLGVMRGLETAIRTNDPNQQYELRSYSQGNINTDGMLNNMVRKGDSQNLTNFTLSHTGTPMANKRFEGSDTQSRLGYQNKGSIGNLGDWVPSESTGLAGPITKGLASEMIQINLDPSKFDEEKKKFDEGKKGDYFHENFEGIPGLGKAMGVGEEYPLLIAPKFDIPKNEKKEFEIQGYEIVSDDEVEKIYQKQFPERNQDIDIKEKRKFIDKELSQHRLYFDEDFTVVKQLLEKERQKEEALEKGNKEDYIKLIEEQKQIQEDRQKNIKNILLNIYIPKPEDFKESRNNVWIPEAVDEMQKNNPYKGFQIEDFQNPGIPKKGNDNPEELNDILNNLRNRVGN